MTNNPRWDAISPLDSRYFDPALQPYLSENGFTRYKLEVEAMLAEALAAEGLCSLEIAEEIRIACELVTTEEVYAEEEKTRHDIRALVNCIREKVSDAAKPFVHLTATSFDIIDTANAMRYKRAIEDVILPSLLELQRTLIDLAKKHSPTKQVARTHGQHAVTITFGFAIAQFIERLGGCILNIRDLIRVLPGKFSGATGAYNASSLYLKDPEKFETRLLECLDLKAAAISTQICPPEDLIRVFGEVCLASGVIANLARDMRNLQRTEIAEVGEMFEKDQVGSSTMPQKRNPIGFENVESMWKIIIGRFQTLLLDQVSEHQRDLTGSASGRTYGEILGYFYTMVKRITKVMSKLEVNADNLTKNLEMSKGAIGAEPLYIILAKYGHPDAHEVVRVLVQGSRDSTLTLLEKIEAVQELVPYLAKMSAEEYEIVLDPTSYTGLSDHKAQKVARDWERILFPS